MTSRDHSLLGRDRRAVSEVVGYTLLVGIVTVTVIALLVGAMSVQSAIQDQTESESVQQEMQDVDATFGRIAHGDNRTSVNVQTETANRLSVVREGEVRIFVNDECNVTRNLSSIRHEKDGETLAYELGGRFRVTDGGVGIVSPPDLAFENGTVDLTITNLTGRTASSMTFVKDVERSMGGNETDQVLFEGTCSQPENVTVSITSDFADGWERYAEDEFPAGTVSRSGDTVNVTLNRSHLPEEADPANNTVVDFSNTSHYDVDGDVPSITITKPDDSNVYPVRMKPIYQGMQVTRTAETEVDTDYYRRGIDVVFVLDESGSMGDPTPDGNIKRDAMVGSSQTFLGYLNNSIDRAGIVGYNSTYHTSSPSHYHLIDDQYYLSNDFVEANKTLETLVAQGGTRINEGLYKMLAINDLTSGTNRKQIGLLLTDGKNNPEDLNDDTIERAKDAAANDIVIYTIGFGDPDGEFNETLLKRVADITGGEYHYATNASELEDVFEDIAISISSRKKVVHDPASMKLATGGSTFRPKIPTSPDYVANYSGFLNVNDPAAAANFSFTFGLENGEPLNLTSYKYECDEWELTGDVKVNNTTEEQYYVTRCAEINDSADSQTKITGSDIHVYTSGNTTSDVKDDLGETQWFQANFSEALEPYVNDSTDEFELESNQAIVGVNYSNGQRMLLLLEIGRNQGENDLTHVVDVTIDDVEIEEKDEQSS
ncbi:MAG: vWA domain-containing protein [archaeon]